MVLSARVAPSPLPGSTLDVAALKRLTDALNGLDINSLKQALDSLTNVISNPDQPSQSVIQGYPNNATSLIIVRILCPTIIPESYRFADIPVPNGMSLLIKGWPTNLGLVYVGYSPTIDVNTSYPLARNETLSVAVQNANALYVSAVNAGDSVVLLVERRGFSG